LIIRLFKARSCSVWFSLGKIQVMDEGEHVQKSGLPAITYAVWLTLSMTHESALQIAFQSNVI
jgi:hypothetical protein